MRPGKWNLRKGSVIAVNSQQYSARRAAFRKLHESGCFMLPNPYDVGTAVYLKHLGFKALASTSSGFAFSRGLPDHAVTRDMVLAHLRELVAATDLPVNADYEHGYADAAEEVAENVRLAVATGIAGVSIEDSTNDKSKPPLYELAQAVERLRAARAAIDATGEDVMLIGRAECFLVGQEDALNEFDPPPAGLCGSRRRLSLCAGCAQARRPRSVGQSGRAEAVQPSRRRRVAADAR